MSYINADKEALIQRLELKGMAKGAIFGFIWSLKSCVLDNPNMTRLQIEKRLRNLGWERIDLDAQTFQMAIKCFKTDPSENVSEYANSNVKDFNAD